LVIIVICSSVLVGFEVSQQSGRNSQH